MVAQKLDAVKIDYIVYTNSGVDLSAIPDFFSGATSGGYTSAYETATGIINQTNLNVSTTGVISGSVFKISGNITVIDSSGVFYPYGGIYAFPEWGSAGPSTSHSIFYDSSGKTKFTTLTSTALTIALGKC